MVGPMLCVYTLILCLLGFVVLGPNADVPGGALGGMPVSDLLAAWNAPFESTDPQKSGCPALPVPPSP